MHSRIHLPHTNLRIHPVHKTSIGGGYGTVLLDGGMGGQSSYRSLDDYINTTGRDPLKSIAKMENQSGSGLADKISEKLSKLKIEAEKTQKGRPKRKNIVMSI